MERVKSFDIGCKRWTDLQVEGIVQKRGKKASKWERYFRTCKWSAVMDSKFFYIMKRIEFFY
jgi:hypothetical protein